MQKKYCWEIRRYNGSHTCTRSTIFQNHSKLDSKTVAEVIKPLVEVDPSIKVKSVITKVQSKFNYTLSYCKAWLAKKKTKESIFGGWEASYEALSIWFEAMCHKEPLAVDIQILQASSAGGRDSFVILYGKYKGCLLVAVLQDGNNNIVPIAFAIVEGETSDAWYFFLSNLRQYVVTRDGVELISNRHDSVRTIREFQMRYQRLREQGETYTNWLDRIPREQYALAFDGGYRWDHMTTNLVECINSVLKGSHDLPVIALVKATFYRLNELFTRKRTEADARINAGHVFSELVTSKLHANQRASENILVSCFDRENEVFEVREMPSRVKYAVDLRR
ncbi:uncharacterized protein LOC130967038 [Arachis stenosperma]|uniref:uncharacterized protein LOC130967038 n=1 Tax=Arachis stenosperma TaxID=217475 RepID=UPI0025AC1E18|nr:uncharacterized protein LOC130967038 [Arachis stenosperma]